MYLNVSAETMPKDIAPFEVGYKMAAFRLCNKSVSLGLLNLP